MNMLDEKEYKNFMRLARMQPSCQVRISPDSHWIRFYIADNSKPDPLFEISREPESDGSHRFRFCEPYDDGYKAIDVKKIGVANED